jgi:hypothetical protein
MILVRHPNKLYMSFKATSSSDSKFFIQTFYAKTATADTYVNYARCSDKGASLGKMQSIIDEIVVDDTDVNEVLSFDPRIGVLSKDQREALIYYMKTEPLFEEVFVEPEPLK